jgi:hypothetical protein
VLKVLLITAVLSALAPLSAEAMPRDQVMSTAFLCSVISADHQWLDCFYGAAQPVRAALGLRPASDAQVRLARQPPGGGAVHNEAARNEAMVAAARCYDSPDDRQWLHCYYAAAQKFRALLGLNQTPAAQAGQVDARSEAFAVRRSSTKEADDVSTWLVGSRQALTDTMVSYGFDRLRNFTVTLANGQVWRQVPGDIRVASWKKPARFYTVIISRGALGSTNLRIAGEPGMFKVDRIR